MKQLLCLIVISILIGSQVNGNFNQKISNGIEWIDHLSWDQIKAKAKAENKYIFLDVYTTWCGPCKRMDKEVYVNDSISDYINAHFVSVKVQMDKTKNDNDIVKRWYDEARQINKKYKVTSFPTYLFFSPNGILVHKETGYKSVNSFLSEVQKAVTPGTKYNDPYLEYDTLLENYQKGKREYDKFPYLVQTANQLGDFELAAKLSSEFYTYLGTLNKQRLYSNDNITFIAKNINNSQDKYFYLFYANGKKVDAIVKKKGFAKATVDRVIRSEEIIPEIKKIINNHGMKALNPGLEPDWEKIRRNISIKYGVSYADRNIRVEKVNFYWLTKNIPSYIENAIIQYINNEIDTTDKQADINLNSVSWEIFQTSSDKEKIFTAIEIIEGVLRRKNAFKEFRCLPLDTYANLLYKASMLNYFDRIKDAIFWENKALDNAVELGSKDAEIYRACIERMKGRLPTWK
jgi:thioredoxin-related protein